MQLFFLGIDLTFLYLHAQDKVTHTQKNKYIQTVYVICIYMNLWGVSILELDSLCLEVLSVHGNEFRLSGVKEFPSTRTINVSHLT